MFKFLKSLVDSSPSNVTSQIPDVASAVASATSTTIKSIKPHVPLIKFRKGESPTSGKAAIVGGATSSSRGGHITMTRGTIEDYQLPARYRRQPLDQVEIDYINRGGPE